MLMEWPFLFVGFFAGALGTLIGAGGGIILIPVMLLLYPQMPPEKLTAISLGMICANSVSGTISYARMGRVVYSAGLIFAAATIPGSLAGAWLVQYLPKQLFAAIFSAVLIMVAIYILIRPGRHDRPDAKINISSQGLKYGTVLSFGVGFLATLLGIGGGIVHVPVMVYLVGLPVHAATATSHFVLAIMSATATAVHIYNGSFEGSWLILFYLAAGAVIGAQVGALLSKKVKGLLILRILAVALGLTGIRILLIALK